MSSTSRGLASFFLLIAAALAGSTAPAWAVDLRGHGGPVRAIAMGSGDVVTGSFDTTIIRWDLATGRALLVHRFHDGAVNTVLRLPDGGFATAGEDRRIAIWRAGESQPHRVLEGHTGPIAGLALSPDGQQLASASWDGTVRLWPLAGGEAQRVEGHRGPVNAVAYLPDRTLVTAGYDGLVRILRPGGSPLQVEIGLPVNTLAILGGEILAAGADGQLRFIDAASGAFEAMPVVEVPIVAVAVEPKADLVAVAGFRGALVMIERGSRKVFRRMAGPAFPLWSLAFSADGREILTGGADRLVRRWLVATGEPVNPVLADQTDALIQRFAYHRGAEVFKACIACHTLTPDDGNRAGPTLHGVIGRRIGTAPGYVYSPALTAMDIVWSRETIAKLFTVGPMAYTPGTKMPEQQVRDPADLEALVDFIEKASR
ncbi:c-type cytochrome [Rhabdaerophilum sp. SD176]|uniref:c-type cytochrome n=1 Tax=Rhabdaerophilum sp. SD176 TaxID=2983548 RepID=UPI0024DFEFB5|nr:c-type cytochrome [Rhabdaerophilum sp. SD176]